jgi:hypothetical protein
MAKINLNRGTFLDDPAADSIYTGVGNMNDMFSDLYDTRPQYVTDYGAVGDGTTDDTTAINAAYSAASATGGGGVVIFSGKRTYKITSTITMPNGVHSIGAGGSNASNSGDPPALLWGGSAGGTMVDVNQVSIFGTLFQNLLFKASGTNNPGIGVRFRGASIDSGTRFDECWFNGINGNAIQVDDYATNFRVTGGRFDNITGGYAIYIDVQTGGGATLIVDGNTTYVGGGAVNGNGFLFVNSEGTANGTICHVLISGLHVEINQSLVETYAAGVHPSDKCGVIRLGVNPAWGGIQSDVTCTGITNSSAGVASYCFFQITSLTGTAAAAAACVQVNLMGAAVLNNFNTSDSATTNEIRMFGGNIPDDQRWPFVGYRHGLVLWGRGPDSSYEGVRHYINTNIFKIRGLTIDTNTYANRSTQAMLGTQAIITDSTVTTGSVTAGGGSNVVLVMYNGTNWKVVANIT